MSDVDPVMLSRVVELAVRLVVAERPPSSSPSAALLRLAGRRRLSVKDLRRAGEILTADEDLRRRVHAVATADMVGEDAYAWLADPSRDVAGDRRRRAAEAARDRARAEGERWQRQAEQAGRDLAATEATLEQLRRQLDQALRRADDADNRAERLQSTLEGTRAELGRQQMAWEQARLQLTAQVAELVALRDELIGQRLALEERVAGLGVPGEAASGAQSPTRQPVPPSRTPLGVPGGLLADSVAAARYLVDRTDVVVIVDGYNAVLDPWTEGHLSQRREVLLTSLEGFVVHRGPSVLVVFDGDDSGWSSGRRRFVRVVFTDAGVTADDVMCGEVDQLPTTVPVVVVTDDQDLVRRVRRRGANTIGVGQLWGVLRG